MAEINRDKERQHCRAFYEKWDFIKHIVELYAEGVSWKGVKVIALSKPNKIPPQYSQIIDDEALKSGVRNMLVDGIGDFNLKVLDSMHVLQIPMPKESFLQEAEPPGRSFLWAAARNDKHLEEMSKLLGVSPDAEAMVKLIRDDMCGVLGVPYPFLLPNINSADPSAIKWGLIVFRGKVADLRNYVAYQIQKMVEPLISKALNYKDPIEVIWNENWLPDDRSYGPVYQVFKTRGIELRSLNRQVLEQAKQLLDMHIISKATYDEYAKWFL